MKFITYLLPLLTAIGNSQTNPPQTTQFSYPPAANPGCDSFSFYSNLQATGVCVADTTTSNTYECATDGTINFNVYNTLDCSGNIVYTVSDYCSTVDASTGCVEYCNTGFECEVATKESYFSGDCSAPDNTMSVILDNCVDTSSGPNGGTVSFESVCEYGVLTDYFYFGAGCQGNSQFSTVYPSGGCVHGNETVGICGDSQYNGTYPPITTTLAPEPMDPGCNSFAVGGFVMPTDICQADNDTASWIGTCNPDGTMDQARFINSDCSGAPVETRSDVCNDTNSVEYNISCIAFCDSGLICDTILMETYELPYFDMNDTGSMNDSLCDEPVDSNTVVMDACIFAGGFSLDYQCDVNGVVSENFYYSMDCSGATFFSQYKSQYCANGNETVATCFYANNSEPLYTTTYLPDSTTTTTTTYSPDTTDAGSRYVFDDPGCNVLRNDGYLTPIDFCLGNDQYSEIYTCESDGTVTYSIYFGPNCDPISSSFTIVNQDYASNCSDCEAFCGNDENCDSLVVNEDFDDDFCTGEVSYAHAMVADLCLGHVDGTSELVTCGATPADGITQEIFDNVLCDGIAVNSTMWDASTCEENIYATNETYYTSYRCTDWLTDDDTTTGAPTMEPTVVVTQVSDTTSTTFTTLDVNDSSAWKVSVFVAIFVGFIGSVFFE